MSLGMDRARGMLMSSSYPAISAKSLCGFQDRRLRALVTHAYERVPFYRALYDAHGVDPLSIRGVQDLERLPVTDKRMFQSLPMEQRVARGTDIDSLILRKTSGSSAQPLVVGRTWIEERSLGLLRIRAMRDLGYRLTDRHAAVILQHAQQRADAQWALRACHAAGLLRMTKIDCLRDPQAIYDEVRKLEPQVVTGFPGVLARVGAIAMSAGDRPLRPRLVTCGGETVTPLMRKQIEAGFGAPLFDTYGSIEFNLMAWQCPHGGAMHACDDGVITEVHANGKPARPGERGEIVLTGLHSFAMPLIRYRLGDLVTRGEGPCPCGSPFQTIGSIQGRMIDHFHVPGGRLLHPWTIINSAFENPKLIREFQLLQETQSRVVLRIVPQVPMRDSELNAIRLAAQLALGPDVELVVHIVDRIPLEVTGKFRTSRSLVESHYDGVQA